MAQVTGIVTDMRRGGQNELLIEVTYRSWFSQKTIQLWAEGNVEQKVQELVHFTRPSSFHYGVIKLIFGYDEDTNEVFDCVLDLG